MLGALATPQQKAVNDEKFLGKPKKPFHVRTYFKGMSGQQLKAYKDSAHVAHVGTVGPGDLLYMPCGAIFAEKTSSEEIFGIKFVAVPAHSKVVESMNGCLHTLSDMSTSSDWIRSLVVVKSEFI